ncbi:nucleoside phosphorylase [uncultured Imperialibacter sp.]|uniref:nucleoside phosphorylase n=1 Tax=uncultured Imperialibacter sp. TaxID=1672639 RepID=UPI0030D96B51|tara:strand:- start:132979 stop:133836 length:858 start_codon:yes stop_codon:yes gene_type:complete
MARIPESELILNPDGSVYHLNLKPEHIADTIIAVGDPGRVHQVSQYFDSIEFEMNKREFITHTGYLNKKRVTVISSGIGTDNVEILLTELDALVNIDLAKREPKKKLKSLNIIRIGTSGAMQEDIKLGSYVVSENAIGFDTLGFFYPYPQSARETMIASKLKEAISLEFMPYIISGSEKLMEKYAFDMVKGNTVTAPGFYAPQGRALRLPIKHPNLVDQLMYFHEDNFWITNFEMETAGYYGLSRMMGHSMLSLNAIVVNRAKGTFSKNPLKVVDGLIKKVLSRI